MKFKNFILLFVSVFSLSQAGNIILLCGTGEYAQNFIPVHPYTIAFYRLGIAFLILLPISWKTLYHGICNSDGKTTAKIVAMGLIFSFHLIFWIKAVHHTKVANAAICFSILPVFISLGAYLLWKEKLHKNIFVAISSGMLGILLVGYDDFSLSFKDLIGDIFATISAMLFAAYFLIGKSVRQSKDNFFIMIIVYFFSSLTALMMVFSTWSGENFATLWNFNMKTWIGFIMLAIVPTIFGHATFIYVSKYFRASVTSTFILLEPVFAGIVALLVYDQKITLLTFIGYICIMIGLCFLIWTQSGKSGPTDS